MGTRVGDPVGPLKGAGVFFPNGAGVGGSGFLVGFGFKGKEKAIMSENIVESQVECTSPTKTYLLGRHAVCRINP